MSTQTDNNNAISFSSIQGPTGPIGYTGPVGDPGIQGPVGIDGIPGPSDHISTDIAFSGSDSNGGIRTIDEGGIRLVGSCIFGKQADLRVSASTNVKVLVRVQTPSRQPAEIGLVLNGNIADAAGETRLATKIITVPGTGYEKDSQIVTLTLTSNTLINTEDIISLWAYVKPSQEYMSQALSYLTNLDPPPSIGALQNWKYETYIQPYLISPARLWLALNTIYNTENSTVASSQTTQWLADIAAEDADNISPGLGTITYDPKGKATLLVNYLQIEE